MMPSSFTDTDSRSSQRATMSICFGFDLFPLAIAELLSPKPGSVVGANISPLTLMGKPIKIVAGTMERPVRVVWEPSVFDKIPAATKLNICYEITDPNHQAFFEKLDGKVLQILTTRSAELLKKALTSDQLKMMFRQRLANSPLRSPNILSTQ